MGVHFSNTSMLSLLAAPLQSLATWFVPRQSAAGSRRGASNPRQMVLPFNAEAAMPGCPAERVNTPPFVPSRLRVVREFDSAVGPACAGRMVISGRMADVCAELERMSQSEAP